MKKLITAAALMLVAAMLLSVPAFADDATPADINGEGTYAVTMIENFDEDLGTRISISGDRCTATIEEGIGVAGKAIKFVSGTNTSEAQIKIPDMDFRGYDGILVWVDISGVKPSANNATGIGVRFWSLYSTGGTDYMWTRNTVDPIVQDFEIIAYYLQDGKWNATDPSIMNGERNQLPEGFKGWVYIPFSSYITVQGPGGNPAAGLYNEDDINKFMLLTGPYNFKGGDGNPTNDQVVIFDELQLVKLGVTQEGLEDALKEFRGDEDDEPEDSEPEDSESEFDPFSEDTDAKTEKQDKNTEPGTAKETKETEKAGEKDSKAGLIIGIVACVVVVAAVAAAIIIASKKKKK